MKKQKELMEKIAKSIPDEEENFLCVLANNDGTGITALKGDHVVIAKTLFYQMMGDQPLNEQLYFIVKNVVINMVKNKTEFAKDLMREVTLEITAQNGK